MFLFPDKPLPPDRQVLLDAVGMLDISEFRLFELAYYAWYGEHARPEKLDEDFARYMFREEVPFWVRHYARDVLKKAQQQTPDETTTETMLSPTARSGLRRGLRLFSGLVLLLLFLIVLASHSPEWMLFGAQCYFPPCY
ncbi:hypothetical protein [Thiohalophilus thiocyanatoxydans]|uniref:Uncharacterized protein n=1 Tax=Thiohalophilus thiocyanatoxydans TaxID=381308 RepID=A0A4R8IXR6_9GAMM|nr:hypothetical protein [Thiohalophilus thiocyanatoxydans]TDY02589.1 hypothetical protein EDC23_0964 [Thiohalophilus thiocyanatoxydans]